MRPELSAAFDACNFLENSLTDTTDESTWIDHDILIDAFVDENNIPHLVVNATKDMSAMLPEKIQTVKYDVNVHFKMMHPNGPSGMN